MPRLFEADNNSRSVVIANGAGILFAAIAAYLWISASSDWPNVVKLSFGMLASLAT